MKLEDFNYFLVTYLDRGKIYVVGVLGDEDDRIGVSAWKLLKRDTSTHSAATNRLIKGKESRRRG